MTEPLAVGNTAKLYCLEVIDRLARERERLRVVDLGAGDGRNFVELLARHPHVSYVGVDPSKGACAEARRRLPESQATILCEDACDGDYGTADVVVSFSVLDKVYRRSDYMRQVARTLAGDGVAFVNYDAGHFRRPLFRDRVKNLVGPVAARLGHERWHQRFVAESEFRALAQEAGLTIEEARSFNTETPKLVYLLVPPGRRAAYMRRWLEFELAIAEHVIPYEDAQSGLFLTRNFVLRQRGGQPTRTSLPSASNIVNARIP